VVDHIQPHKGDETLFWDENNWQPLCRQCHDIKATIERRVQANQLSPLALDMRSPEAQAIRKRSFRPPIGLDGYPITTNMRER
jgi:5-methylcytosine-specific restriction endonuclease McrA